MIQNKKINGNKQIHHATKSAPPTWLTLPHTETSGHANHKQNLNIDMATATAEHEQSKVCKLEKCMHITERHRLSKNKTHLCVFIFK